MTFVILLLLLLRGRGELVLPVDDEDRHCEDLVECAASVSSDGLVLSGLLRLVNPKIADIAAKSDSAIRNAADKVFFCNGGEPTDLPLAILSALNKNDDVLVVSSSCSPKKKPYYDGIFDVARGLFDDGIIDVVLKRPPRSKFLTRDPNELVLRATTFVAADTKSTAGPCKIEEADKLGERWRQRPQIGDVQAWDYAALLGCPKRRWFDKIAASWQNDTFTFSLVGANKGFGLAHALKQLAPDLGITPQTWSTALRDPLACGWCRDCLDDDPPPPPEKRRRLRTITAHLIEPLAGNIALIHAALANLGFQQHHETTTTTWTLDRVTVRTLQLAVSAEDGVARFPRLRPGDEVGALCSTDDDDDDDCDPAEFQGRFADGSDGTFDDVAVATLDTLFENDHLDALFIDAEGQDPLILNGGRTRVLPRLALLEFEYHFRGAWATTSLESVVADLDSHYSHDCFLQAPPDALWRLSRGCWRESYEIHQWSNVVCVQRSNLLPTSILAASAVVLPP